MGRARNRLRSRPRLLRAFGCGAVGVHLCRGELDPRGVGLVVARSQRPRSLPSAEYLDHTSPPLDLHGSYHVSIHRSMSAYLEGAAGKEEHYHLFIKLFHRPLTSLSSSSSMSFCFCMSRYSANIGL